MRNVPLFAILLLLAGNACNFRDDCDTPPLPADTIYVHDTVFPSDGYAPVQKVSGLNFSPYKDNQSPGSGIIISPDQIIARLAIVQNYTHYIRTFGATHGLEAIPTLAKAKGLKVYAGAWLSTDLVANQAEIANLIAIGQSGAAEALIVGGEVLYRGDLTPEALIAYLNTVRAAVPGIPVTTADTYDQLLLHPEVMAACDFVFANIYPFWDGISVECAIYHLNAAWQSLVNAAGGKEVVVSETGWPSSGLPIGSAAPTIANACLYFEQVSTWSKAMNVKTFYFEATDEPWKSSNESEWGAHWGIFNNGGQLKSCMRTVFDDASAVNYFPCPSCPSAQIVFSDVPPYGAEGYLRGNVAGVDPETLAVAVYIKVGSGWWSKPTFAQNKTVLFSDGSWVTDIVTGGDDAHATEITAYLIPSGFDPPVMEGGLYLPPELSENALARAWVKRSL